MTIRVRIHLNLAHPQLAQCAVKIQSPTKSWITVAYATELLLKNCIPVVDLKAQQKISLGATRKIPHAFIEADLHHINGFLRQKAPTQLKQLFQKFLISDPNFKNIVSLTSQPINYNPRFANCFYLKPQNQQNVNLRFDSCKSLAVIGWSFLAQDCVSSPIPPSSLCPPSALSKTKISETRALKLGLSTTQSLVKKLNPN